jgi:hypothetical protein
MVRLLRHRGIEVRLVLAPYAPSKLPANAADFARFITRRTGEPVWNYVAALDDPDSFFDTVHLNQRGSLAFLAILRRDGVLGMTGRAERF